MCISRLLILAVFTLLIPSSAYGQRLLDRLRDAVDPADGQQQPILDRLRDTVEQQGGQQLLDQLRDAVQPKTNSQELPAPVPGYLGAILDDRQQGGGIRVLEVVPGGPADKGGLKQSDLITSINEKPVRVMNDLAQFIRDSTAGTKLDFDVTRPGTQTNPDAKLALEITLGVRPPREERRFPEFGRIPEPPAQGDAREQENPSLLGVRAVPLNLELFRRLRLPVARGAVVVAVVQGSAADKANLPRDAVIVAVNNRAIDSPDDLARRVQLAGPGAQIELAYYYRGQLVRKQITLGKPTVEVAPPDESPIRQPDAPRRTLEERIEQLEAEVRELRRLLESR